MRTWFVHGRFLLVGSIVLAQGSGCSVDPDCSFERVLAKESSGHGLRDCGYPAGSVTGEPADSAPWRAAHDCAVTSASSREPFIVRWLVPEIEGATKYAVMGRVAGGEWSLAQFIENFNADGGTRPTIEYTCAALGDQGDCADLTRTLCVTCSSTRAQSEPRAGLFSGVGSQRC